MRSGTDMPDIKQIITEDSSQRAWKLSGSLSGRLPRNEYEREKTLTTPHLYHGKAAGLA